MNRIAQIMAAFLLGATALLPLGCSADRQLADTAKPPSTAAEQPSSAPAQVAELSPPDAATPVRDLIWLEDVCASLLPDASYDELRAVFGDGVSTDEEGNLFVSAGEGRSLEPVKSQHVDDALIGFDALLLPGNASKWTLYGVRVGDSWSALQQANGNPFREIEGGIDWNKGLFDQDRCIYSATFEMPPDMPDDASPSKYGIISSLSLRWRRDAPTVANRLPLPAPVPGAMRHSFEEICARLREDMSPEDLRRIFGAQNMREASYAQWMVFPDDPHRTFTVEFRSSEPGAPPQGIYSIIIDSPTSTWALPNGVGLGDTAAMVEKTVGAPFTVWRQNVTTAGGAALDKDNANPPITCSYHPTFRHDRALIETNRIQSNDATFLSWRPYVASIRVDWRWF